MKWVIVILTLTSGGQERPGPRVETRAYTSLKVCEDNANRLMNEQDWVLICTPRKKK